MYMLAVEAYSRGQIAKGWPVLLEDVMAHLKADHEQSARPQPPATSEIPFCSPESTTVFLPFEDRNCELEQ
jgi:hypothetical protein